MYISRSIKVQGGVEALGVLNLQQAMGCCSLPLYRQNLNQKPMGLGAVNRRRCGMRGNHEVHRRAGSIEVAK